MVRPRRAALLEAVEAVYHHQASAETWLEDLVRAAAPALDTGVGVHGIHVRFEDGTKRLGSPVLIGGTAAWHEQWLDNWWRPVIEAVEPEALRGMLGFGAISSAQQIWDAAARGIPTLDAHLRVLSEQGWAAAFRREGSPGKLFYVDSLNVCALTSTGQGVALVANRQDVLRTAELRAARRRFARLAAHVATALRARETLGERAPTPESGEAVLTPTGRVLHAEGAAQSADARASLRRAALDLERARSARVAEEEALQLWHCLVDGRWTLLEDFESDGQRYLVAVPNAPRDSAPELSARESQVLAEVGRGLSNKEIAYSLGLAPSTVATLVARAAKKLGTQSRVAPVRRARQLLGESSRS